MRSLLGALCLAQLAYLASSSAEGYCTKCGKVHHLPTTPGAVDAVRALRGELLADANFSRVLETERGKMVGVLECETPTGETIFLRAFAGKFGGSWERAGWSPPIGAPADTIVDFVTAQNDVEDMSNEVDAIETRLAALCLAALQPDPPASASADVILALKAELAALKQRRKVRATDSLRILQAQQIARNFRGEERALAEVFVRESGAAMKFEERWHRPGWRQKAEKGLPSGVGECAAPRMLNDAARRGLRPCGVAEIFVGSARDHRRQDGELYDACEGRCSKILGFMLCGLSDVPVDDDDADYLA